MSKPLQTEFHSEKACLQLHSKQARDQIAKAEKQIQECDRKLPPMLFSFLEKNNKQSVAPEAFQSQMKALEGEMEKKLDQRTIDQKASITKLVEQLSSDKLVVMIKQHEDRTNKQREDRGNEREATLRKALEQQSNASKAAMMRQLEDRANERDATLHKTLEQQVNESKATMMKQLEDRNKEREAAIFKHLEQHFDQRESTLMQQLDVRMGEHAAAMAKKFDERINEQGAQLRTAHEAEKTQLLHCLNQEISKNNQLNGSIEELKKRLKQADTTISNTNETLAQVKRDIDALPALHNLDNLHTQVTAQQQQITELQPLKENFDTQILKLRNEIPRLLSEANVGSNVGGHLTSEQLETRLLIQYKDLNRDTSKVEDRVEKLENFLKQHSSDPDRWKRESGPVPPSSSSAIEANHTDGMTRAEATSFIELQIQGVRNSFGTKFELISNSLDGWMGKQFSKSDKKHEEAAANLVKQDSLLADLRTEIEALKTISEQSGQLSQLTDTIDRLKGTVDAFDAQLKQKAAHLQLQCDDMAHRISVLTDWQDNFTTNDITRQMVNHIQQAIPRGTQLQLDQLSGRVNTLDYQIRRVNDQEPNKRRKVSSNGASATLVGGN